MNMYYMIRMWEVAVQAEASRLELEAATAELWEMSCKQYEAFAPGKYEWPPLKHRAGRADPSYRN